MNSAIRNSVKAVCLKLAVASAALVPCAMVLSTPARAETHGYVISWFANATNTPDMKQNCPVNGGPLSATQVQVRDLMAVGVSKADAEKLIGGEGGAGGGANRETRRKVQNAGSVNGKPASIYNYPDTVPDPNIELVSGKFAYGFDLGSPNKSAKFEDPETLEKVDNQLWRAIGCTESFRAVPPVMPYPEELAWQAMTDSAPAWLIQITGADLSKDGPVTVTMDRATRHPGRDATGYVLSNATYLIDPGPRSHNVVKGELKGGVLSITPQDLYLQAEMPFYQEIALRNSHMRVKLLRNGNLLGYWGGYQSVKVWSYMYTARSGNGADTIGLYWAVKKLADFDPDPVTGQNRYISATYRLEAVPAYIATADGKIVATPVSVSEAGAQLAQNPAAANN